tara:strand:+ start:107 stop:397 length:291 start_codon:yes stop_codon:yes gene_type:complete
MSRYKNNKISKSSTSFKRLKSFNKYDTSHYQPVPKRNTDMYVITQKGDRLDNLANQFYGDANLWWFIARTNHLKTMNVDEGVSLRIPISTDDAVIK